MAGILVTCVGSGVGQSVVDSLTMTAGHRIVGCDANTHMYAYRQCHKAVEAPSIHSEHYLDFILELCREESIDLIIPGHDHELMIFSKARDVFEREDIGVIVAGHDMIAVSRDKYRWCRYFSERGCAIVPTFIAAEIKADPALLTLPAIFKPPGGSASQGIRIVNRSDEAKSAPDSDIVQPYLFPVKTDEHYAEIVAAVGDGKLVQLSEISIQLIFTRASEFAGIFISKNTLKNGVPITIDPLDPAAFAFTPEIMKFVPLLSEKRVVGPVNIQGRVTERGLIFFEMNMRFTGITGNRAQLGFNEVAFLVNDFLGLPARLGGYAGNKVGARQVACTTIPRFRGCREAEPAVCVLGAGGFIGSHFVRERVRSQATGGMFLVHRDASAGAYRRMFASYPEVTLVGDRDPAAESAFCRSDILVNFAGARANEPDSVIFDSTAFQYRQAQRAMQAHHRLIVNISSQSVYDQKEIGEKDESRPPAPENIYAFQKYMGEMFFRTVSERSPATRTVSLRFGRVIGNPSDGRSAEGFFFRIVESLLKNLPVDIPYPNTLINLLDLRDAVRAVFHVMDNIPEDDLPPILNIGGTNISLRDYCLRAAACLGLASGKIPIRFGDAEGSPVNSTLDCRLAHSLGWHPEYPLERTIRDFAAFIASREGR